MKNNLFLSTCSTLSISLVFFGASSSVHANDTPQCFLNDVELWRCVDHTTGMIWSEPGQPLSRIRAAESKLGIDVESLILADSPHVPNLFTHSKKTRSAPKLFRVATHTPKLFVVSAHRGRNPSLFDPDLHNVHNAPQHVPRVFPKTPAIFEDPDVYQHVPRLF